MIVVVNSGVANLTSVMAALGRLQAEAVISDDPEVISGADRVILPGVGAAPFAMANLREKGLCDTLRSLTKPVMGICLGMQMLFTSSEEGESPTDCLDIIKGKIRRMTASSENPIPHMGWNQIKAKAPNHPLLKGVPDDSFVYFVHSYAVSVDDSAVAVTDYGIPFASMVAKDNFFGCQFHPERSGKIGSRILRNFLEI
ncbi:MAG: imidazole glycerol phosphate synthase subunit HisH [Alphaproteobacteria bacterium]|nr:imidazole glycerol phosphate synthase subunit HisH [Alphaproteobacteria bacterium]